MGKRKFRKGRAVYEEIPSRREEKLFETEYWKKFAKVINKLSFSASRLKKGLKRIQN